MSWPRFGALAIGPLDALDVVLTSILIYYMLLLIRGTRALSIMVGLLVLVGILGISKVLHLLALATLMQYMLLGIAVTLPIVFQPELRRGLEQIGRGGIFARREAAGELLSIESAVSILAQTASMLSRQRVGALIVIEQATGLKEFVESGATLDAVLSLELLMTVFTRSTPLHDGAVIISHGRVAAAGCFLPLSENFATQRQLGTRHRAALGLSEQTDAVVLVISEQSGHISVARGGRLSREINDEERLRKVLLACMRPLRERRQAGRRWVANVITRIPRAGRLTEKLRT